MTKTLSEKLRHQAINVESDGWLNAARYMHEAADELEYLYKVLNRFDPNWQTTAVYMEQAVVVLDQLQALLEQIPED
jgi:hypothetical protein